MGSKKIKFEIEQHFEGCVIGISTHLKDYRLIWFMNKDLAFSFKKIEDIMYNSDPAKPEEQFSMYTNISEVDHLEYSLIVNKKENELLIPTLKAANYLLIINGFLLDQSKNLLIKELRKVKNVLTVFEIEIDKHKKLNELITQVELHITELKKKADKIKKLKFNIKDIKKLKDDSNIPKN